jgi:hypothetical protein
MPMRGCLLKVVRRFAAGIDVGQCEVRLVVMSRKLLGEPCERVEHAARAPLPPGAMLGAELAEPVALTRALASLLDGVPNSRPAQGLRCVMALPPAASVVGHATLAELSPFDAASEHAHAAARARRAHAATAEGGARCRNRLYSWRASSRSAGALRLLEPAVLATAERYLGLERSALAVDWFIEDPAGAPERVTIAAASRHHIDARVEAAAAAGIVLAAIDDEPAAALRACRHAAAHELAADEAHAVVWIGADSVRGWMIVDGAARRELRHPRLDAASLGDALAALVAGFSPQCAFVCGDVARIGVDNLGAALGCIVLPFDWPAFCGARAGATIHRVAAGGHRTVTGVGTAGCEGAADAVAFGLALRGLDE